MVIHSLPTEPIDKEVPEKQRSIVEPFLAGRAD
jgi:hypothetical protein